MGMITVGKSLMIFPHIFTLIYSVPMLSVNNLIHSGMWLSTTGPRHIWPHGDCATCTAAAQVLAW